MDVVGEISTLHFTMPAWSGRGFLGPIFQFGSQGSVILIPDAPCLTRMWCMVVLTVVYRVFTNLARWPLSLPENHLATLGTTLHDEADSTAGSAHC